MREMKMRGCIQKIMVLVVAAALMAGTAGNVLAMNQKDYQPSASAMVADTLIARPLGFATIFIGGAMWLVALPFSAPSGSIGLAGEKMVVEPAKFTFVRPLGDF